MQYFDCPVIGRRPRNEFTSGGRAIALMLEDDAAAARTRLNFGRGVATVRTEWWYHTPSALWFTIERDTATDEVGAVRLARPFT